MSQNDPHINDLFRRVAGGDEAAFTTLFYHYTRKLHPFLLKKLCSDELAEELLQDIFLKLWVYRERLSGLDSPEGYLFRIATNRVYDHFREEGTRKKVHLDDQNDIPDDKDPEYTMDLNEARRVIAVGVRALPEQRRLVYTLRQEGMRYEEIAAQLGISVNTVRNQLVSANRFLFEFLSERGLPILLLMLAWKTPELFFQPG